MELVGLSGGARSLYLHVQARQLETATVVDFDYLSAEGNMFSLNPARERTITQLDEWDVEIKGRIVGLSDDAGLVDCGGVIIPIYRFTADRAAVGTWVGAVLKRLEAEVA